MPVTDIYRIEGASAPSTPFFSYQNVDINLLSIYNYNMISDELRLKLSIAAKLRNQKYGNPNKGKPMSEEQKRKISLKSKGRKHTTETKIKISIAKKGQPSPLKGRKMSTIQKQKISISRQGKCKGINNPMWKGGISSINKIERDKFRKQYQKKIFERDGYSCVSCKKGGALQVDHIKSWASHPKLRFEESNCRTVCQPCHYQLTYGKPMPLHIKQWGHNMSKRS